MSFQQRPYLGIKTMDVGYIQLSWQKSWTDYRLQQSTDTGWEDSTAPPVMSETHFNVTVPIDPDVKSAFFRLAQNAITPGAISVRWGNFIGADGPTDLPPFSESDFHGPNYTDGQIRETPTRTGIYRFPEPSSASRQILWLPQSLGTPIMKVSNFNWELTPSSNTPYQVGLEISGVKGDVYLTAYHHGGGYDLQIT